MSPREKLKDSPVFYHSKTVALACHSMGGWSEVAVEQIDKIIQVMAATRGEEPAELSLHTFQRLGIVLQRGNAAMMARRMDFLSAEVDGSSRRGWWEPRLDSLNDVNL